jgi:hypothetical protein
MSWSAVSPIGDVAATVPPPVITFLTNVAAPALVCAEGAYPENASKSWEGHAEPGSDPLTPSAVAARRRCCQALLMFLDGCTVRSEQAAQLLATAVGTAVGCSLREALDACSLQAGQGGEDCLDRPSAVRMLYWYVKAWGPDKMHLVTSDPFLGPLYRRRSCATCGTLRGESDPEYRLCSLCKDPAVGRFCCKDPCFASFWKGGHSKTCAGRDKLKEAKKKAKGG